VPKQYRHAYYGDVAILVSRLRDGDALGGQFARSGSDQPAT